MGFDELFLWVLDDNIAAKKFYEHLGFLQTEDYLDNTIGGKDLREVRFIYKKGDRTKMCEECYSTSGEEKY